MFPLLEAGAQGPRRQIGRIAALAVVGAWSWRLAFAREAFPLFLFPGWWMRGREGGVGVVQDPLLRGG